MRNSSLIILIVSVILVGCVPARKYEELESKYLKASEELKTCKEKSLTWEATNAELTSTVEEQKKQIDRLVTDSTSLGRSYRNTLVQYKEIKENHKILKEQYDNMLKLQEKESRMLGLQLEETKYELQKKEDRLNKLEEELKTKELSLEKLSDDLKAREKRVNELEALIAKKDEAVQALKDKVANALLSFKDKGLNVVEKDGKVYVSMEAKLLFASGKTAVGAQGKEAVVQLAKALEGVGDLEVLVEGHTDTDAFKSSAHPQNNWELSVLRSTAVVEIMMENSNIDPKILTAAGRSEYLPVSEDKAKNRRIEVILIPKLNELYEIINGEN